MNTIFFLPWARGFALLSLLCGMLLLPACASGLLSPGPAPARLALNPAPPAPLPGKSIDKQLVVTTPLCGKDLDNDRIALLFGRELRYLADNRWTDNLPVLLKAKMIEALEATGSLGAVGNDASGLSADARLLTDLRAFALTYETENSVPVATFEAGFKLLNPHNGKVAASLSVSEKTAATGKKADELARAMEDVLQRGLHKMAAWAVGAMRQ